SVECAARLRGGWAETERRRGHDWLVKRFEEKERDARARAEVIRKFLTSEEPPHSTSLVELTVRPAGDAGCESLMRRKTAWTRTISNISFSSASLRSESDSCQG